MCACGTCDVCRLNRAFPEPAYSPDDWEPGDLLTDGDGSLFFVVDHVPVDRDNQLYTSACVVDADGNGWRRSSLDGSARRLLVIDPEDAEEVARLLEFIRPGAMGGLAALQAALRAMLQPPKPPKPDEPLGLGAVVRDAESARWVRVGPGRSDWQREDDDVNLYWSAIDAVEVLSEGIR